MKSINCHILKILFAFLLVIQYNDILAQKIKSDMQLLQESDNYLLNKNNNIHLNNTNPIEFKNSSVIVKYNPFSLVIKGSMLFYQHIVSPQLFRHCLYEISCSNYSKHAIHNYGIIKGVFLSADRLMRCNSMVKEEIPPYKFNENGLAIEEPIKYHTH